jgi:hypothetical protein
MNFLNTMTRMMMGMLNVIKFLGGVAVCSLFVMQTAQADGKDRNKQSDQWALPGDLLQTSNQISFNQGANDTWFFMESRSLEHNVLGYKLLPNYSSVCPAEVEDLIGLACWWDAVGSTNSAYPHVGINFNDHDVNGKGRGLWPSKTLVLHPQQSRLAIIAWRSPDTQRIDVTGTISSLYPSIPCGDGVRWSIEKGTTVLASGDTAQVTANLPFALKHLMLEEGETLYIIADPKTSDFCDSTTVNLAIN